MSDTKLYETLGVSRNATDNDLKKAYRRLAKEYHPDKNPAAGDRFKEIQFAYDILSNPKKREIYDRFGMKGLQEGGMDDAGPSFGEDIFSHFFGGGLFGMGGFGGGGRRRRQRGEDTVHPLKVSLEDMYNGKVSKLQLSKNIICSDCNGRGGAAGATQTCTACRGRGIQVTMRQLAPGMVQQMQKTCSDCQGEGERISEKDRCKTCKGRKVINQTKLLDVHVDKGMRDGEKIYFRGEGDQQPDMDPGDVIIVLQMKPHDVFVRKEENLIMKKSISLTEALCGFTLVIKHLDGRDLVVNHPVGSIIHPGTLKTIPCEGMPIYKNPFEKGNLFIQFDVNFPENNYASEDKIKKLETLLPPRPKFTMPPGEHVEEVNLMEFEASDQANSRRNREAYESDDEDHHGPGVQCASQ